MSTSLRRKLAALQQMTEANGCTPGEASNAAAAIERLLGRLGVVLDEVIEPEPIWAPPPSGKRAGRRPVRPKRPRRLRIGDIIDAVGHEGLFGYCRCGGGRFEIVEGGGGHPAWLRCCKCTRSRAMRAEHFGSRGREIS